MFTKKPMKKNCIVKKQKKKTPPPCQLVIQAQNSKWIRISNTLLMSSNCLAQTDFYLPWNSIPYCRDTILYEKLPRSPENDNDFLLKLGGDQTRYPSIPGKNSCSLFSDFPHTEEKQSLNIIIHVTGKNTTSAYDSFLIMGLLQQSDHL